MKEKEYHFDVSFEGEIMAQETINFTLSVQSTPTPLTVVDAAGNPLADGATVALKPEVVGVPDPGQVLFTVSGGTAPFTFTLASGAIPDGDQLSSVDNPDGSETVSISGTPTTPGPAVFAIMIADSGTQTRTVSVKKSAVSKK